MKLTEHIRSVFDDKQAGKDEAALLHACCAVDGTAKHLYPSEPSSKKRFIRCVREYYWLVEPMMVPCINLEETRWENLALPNTKGAPDFADVVYAIHRCNHAHGDEVPIAFQLTKTGGAYGSEWEISADCLRMPDRLIWALTSVVIFCRINDRYRGWGEGRYLSWGEQRFQIAEWWGREAEIKPMAIGWNSTRVRMAELGRLKEAARSRPSTWWKYGCR